MTTLKALPDIHIPMVLTALAPISHGAGTSGNTQLLRTRDVITAAGKRATVPYVSGNSLRHTLRSAIAWHLVRTLEVSDGALSKRVADLLWSGGGLTETGAQADLTQSRRVHQLAPSLGMLGYAAKSDIVAGTLWVDDVDLVCAENVNRMPLRLADHAHASLPNGTFRTETFGTRHDITGSPVDRFVAIAMDDTTSTQMIYDMQVIKPGSVLYTGLHLATPTDGHIMALATAIDESMPIVDGRRTVNLGGKRGSGYGACSVELGETCLDIAEARAAYEAHLHDNRDEILQLLAQVTG